MAFDLSDDDRRALDAHINMVLTAYGSDTISLAQASSSLADLFASAASDDAASFKHYIRQHLVDLFGVTDA